MPHVNLECGGGTQAQQTASIMQKFEVDLKNNPADLVLVVGDVTSTMACSIVAQKLKTKVAHIEAGIRSGDWEMPEEINRIVTDSISNYYFTTTELASENLRKVGVSDDKIYFVGNTMIDTLLKNKKRFYKPAIFDEFKLTFKNYIVITFHRPSNVDDPANLEKLLSEIVTNSAGMPVIFPVHPRTQKQLESISFPTLHYVSPMNYLCFNYLVEHAKVVITDSGGITEETTVMGVPCITLRDSTERPETCIVGTNELIGSSPSNIRKYMQQLLDGNWKKGGVPFLWDGNAGKRIVEILVRL